MEWNEKKCSVTHIKRGPLDQSTGDMKVEEFQQKQLRQETEEEKWQGKLLKSRWND